MLPFSVHGIRRNIKLKMRCVSPHERKIVYDIQRIHCCLLLPISSSCKNFRYNQQFVMIVCIIWSAFAKQKPANNFKLGKFSSSSWNGNFLFGFFFLNNIFSQQAHFPRLLRSQCKITIWNGSNYVALHIECLLYYT